MSAPSIPNLNTLRRGRGGLRGRARAPRGYPSGGDHPHDSDSSQAKDRIILGTDNDASVSRLSAVELGYLEDPFARAVAPSTSSPSAPSSTTGPGAGVRRLPIINRGTYVRTTAIDELVNRFLEDDDGDDGQPPRKKQIISLGAGSDTRVFRIFARRQRENRELPVYHEIDLPANTASKIRAIRTSPVLQRTIGIAPEGSDQQAETGETVRVEVSDASDALHSANYHIHPVDLRTLAPPTGEGPESGSSSASTSLPGVDTSLPTLLISECCLIYLSPADAARAVNYFATLFPQSTPLGLIIYEPIRPDDPFGRTMVSNLAARGIHLQTLHKYATLEAQRRRLEEHGFSSGQGVADIDFIWQHWVSDKEKERVATLEMLDEMEEWVLLAQHYCLVWGWRENPDGSGRSAYRRWKEVKSQETGLNR